MISKRFNFLSLSLFLSIITLSLSAQPSPPIMGWASWNHFHMDISEKVINEQADAMFSSGLKELGYKYINIDDGFFNGRSANGYYSLMKEKAGIVLTRRFMGESTVVQRVSYTNKNVYLKAEAQGLYVQFSYGESTENMQSIGTAQKLDNIADNKMNKFNGPGIGVYATSNGILSKNKAIFDWFEYTGKE